MSVFRLRVSALAVIAAALIATAPADAAGGKTITVTSAADTLNPADGLCTLREAAIAANTNKPSGSAAGECPAGGPGIDTITFNIGAATIVTSGVELTAPVIVDGGSQVSVRGATQTVNLFVILGGAAGSTIRGLRIDNCEACIDAQADNLTIVDNWIGSTTGTTSSGGAIGVFVRGKGTHVGQVGHGNLISGLTSGIKTFGKGTVIQGNFIGTTADGSTALGNATGIDVGAAGTQIGGSSQGQSNLISGNAEGIHIENGAAATRIQRNIIGMSANGASPLGNTTGINDLGGSGTVVGGPMPASSNLFGATAGAAVILQGAQTTARTSITGNIFGVGLDGRTALGNFVAIQAQWAGRAAITGNLIAHSQDAGVVIVTAESANNTSMSGNCFQGNATGVADAAPAHVNANGNWWGALVGPNMTGADTTTGQVDVSKWLVRPPASCQGWGPASFSPADPGFKTLGPTKFSWANVPTASGYTFTLANANGGLLLDHVQANGRKVTVLDPLSYGRFFWSIQTILPSGLTWTSAQHTLDITLMKAPKPDAILGVSKPVKFSWSAAKPAPAGGYDFTIYSAPTCQPADIEVGVGGVRQLSITRAVPIGAHYWRVSYFDGANTISMPCWALTMLPD